MKKYFFTGLVILLPFVVTLFLVIFVINFLTHPFQAIVENILRHYHLFSNGSFFVFTNEQVLSQVSKIIALIALFLILIFFGFIARLVFVKYFFKLLDHLFHRIPFFNKIYTAFQEMLRGAFYSKGSNFSQVVLAPFPHDKIFCIGLIPNHHNGNDETEEISVFIPGTPNPTAGYLLKFNRKDVIFTDMRVEEALKFVVSCGILHTDFSVLPCKNTTL